MPRARRARRATVDHAGPSPEESYSYGSRGGEELARELEELPGARSWRHGVGDEWVTVPGWRREEVVQLAHHRRRRRRHDGRGEGADGPEKLLEQLDAGRYVRMPFRSRGGAEDVGSRLSRYREMGKYFKAGSVGDASRVRNDSGERPG